MFLSYFYHDYEIEESNYIYHFLKPGDYCVDIGARHGWFTGIMANKVGKHGRVYAFEPLPPTSGAQAVAAANGFTWVTVVEKGLSNSPGIAKFNHSSLSMHTSGPQVEVEVVTLDEAIKDRRKKIALMKIDIEGAEYLALSGAVGVLQKDRPKLVMELSPIDQKRVSGVSVHELIDFVKEFGYDCSDFSGKPLLDSEVAAAIETGRILNAVFEVKTSRGTRRWL